MMGGMMSKLMGGGGMPGCPVAWGMGGMPGGGCRICPKWTRRNWNAMAKQMGMGGMPKLPGGGIAREEEMTMTSRSRNCNNFRKSIDNLDDALIRILAERFRITKAVGVLKATTIFLRPIRPGEDNRSSGFAPWRLKPISIPILPKSFFNFIIDEVIRHHEQARS